MKAFAQNAESHLNILVQILKEEKVGIVMIVDTSLGLHIKGSYINHQNQGTMTKEEIDKVCGILHEILNSDTIAQYLIFDDENIDFDSELFFEDLRKAMEE